MTGLLVVVGYLVVGMFVARWVKIRLDRKVRGLPAFGECNHVCRLRPKGCRRCRRPAYSHLAGVLTVLSWIFWPPILIVAAKLWLIEQLVAAVKITIHSAPARSIGQGWQWFWTDPQERKAQHSPIGASK